MLKAIRVIIIEDSADDVEVLRLQLTRGGFNPQITVVSCASEFHTAVSDGADVVLVDYTLPHFSVRGALGLLRELESDIPLIVVTGSVGEEVAVECMREGAADYLLKDRLARLPAAVNRAIERTNIGRAKRLAERARDNAVRELDHRVRNNLAIVLGLSDLARRHSSSIKDFSESLVGRIRALEVAHRSLSASRWLGSDLRQLVLDAIEAPRAESFGRVTCTGKQPFIRPRTVPCVALALQEIATRSIETGAWTKPNREVAINILVLTDGGAMIHWEEDSRECVSDEMWHHIVSMVRHECKGHLECRLEEDRRRFELSLPHEACFDASDDPIGLLHSAPTEDYTQVGGPEVTVRLAHTGTIV